MELGAKLNSINSALQTGNDAEAGRLLKFESFLVQDTFSEDFQKDFAHYYTNTFFGTPNYFISPSTPWHKYFSDPTKLMFQPRQLQAPGLYSVEIDIAYTGTQGQFFSNGQPS